MTRSLIRFWNALRTPGDGVRAQAARDELERRVQERTAELLAANQALQAEALARGGVENALRESEARFRSTFNDAPIGMTLVSADNRILQTNRAHSEFLGYSEQELTGMSILDVTFPEDREETSRVSRQMRDGGARIERHQKRYLRKDGKVVWGEVSVSMIRDADGKLSYTIAQIVDITQRRQAEEALRRSESLFRVITDNAQDAIFLKDREGCLLFVNPAALAIVGGTAENVIGKTAEQIHTDPEFIRVIRENDQRVMNSGKMEALEETVHGPMGTRTYLTMKVPYHDGAGRVIGLVCTARDSTDRKRAEQALRESEARFRSTFSDAPTGMTVLSADMRILQTNRAFCEFLGYCEQELTGMNVLDATYPEDREETSRVIRRLCEGGAGIERRQKRCVRKNGEVVWAEESVSAIRDADGKLTYLISQIVDITKRRQAEEALRENEETIRALLNATTDEVFLLDTAGMILALNEMSARGWGRSVEQLVGACAYNFLMPTVAESRKAHFDRSVESGRPLHFEDEHRGIWYDTGVYPIRDSQGKVTRMAVFARDITERKRAEHALRASEQRYRELFEASPTALVEEDWAFVRQRADQLRAEGVSDVRAWFLSHPEEALLCFRRILRLDVNKAALRLFKAADKKELLVNFDGLGCDETRDTVISAIAALAAGNEFFEAEASVLTLTGEKRNLLMSISAAPVAEESLPRYIVSLSDVTDLRKAQQEAIEQRQAAQLQRMESLAVTGRLAAGVAHEINNPLQGIVAQLSLLAGELPESLRQGRRIVLIHDGIDRIAGIVRNLLQLHRPPPAGEESCAASSVISGLADMISSMAANQRIRLEVFVGPPEMTIPMSANALTQVLLNLMLNAIDAMPKGGVIRIEARQTRQEVLVSVSDTGVGIPSEHRTRLFSPFFTTKGPKGTGLGLSVTHSLVTSAGGTIAVNDHKGGGTTFVIRFENERTEA